MRRCPKLRRPSSPWRRNTRPGLADGHLVRAVVDVNVLISGVLSAKGSSAEILRASRDGQFELVVSELLLAELKRTLAYPKLLKRIPPEKAAAFASWVRDHGILAEDPASPPPVGSRDPDDDYLLALAINRRAYLVTGDKDLLVLSDDLPILTPAQFATKVRETS
jgi:putative PIN family toxin of toxin-antitoxin system